MFGDSAPGVFTQAALPDISALSLSSSLSSCQNLPVATSCSSNESARGGPKTKLRRKFYALPRLKFANLPAVTFEFLHTHAHVHFISVTLNMFHSQVRVIYEI